MIEIDGSQESGSGTIVRDAVCFSVLVGKDLYIKNIRANIKDIVDDFINAYLSVNPKK